MARIGVTSDVHGNRGALGAVLARLHGMMGMPRLALIRSQELLIEARTMAIRAARRIYGGPGVSGVAPDKPGVSGVSHGRKEAPC
jgi:hypothetical protein